jgi:hypothetical protein
MAGEKESVTGKSSFFKDAVFLTNDNGLLNYLKLRIEKKIVPLCFFSSKVPGHSHSHNQSCGA